MSNYQYRTLKLAITDKASPLRVYLEGTFPNTMPIRRAFKEKSGILTVEPGTSNPGTLGTAFDLMVRFLIDPQQAPTEPLRGALFISSSAADLPSAIRQVTETAQEAAVRGNTELVARCCWPLALACEIFRSGQLWPGSPLVGLIEEDALDMDSLMALAPTDALTQLSELCEVAEHQFFPHLSEPVKLAPSLKASVLVPADPDLIAGRCLIDLKVVAGAKNARTGARPDDLKKETLFQVIAYALLDTLDEHKIDSFGVYSARYGNLTVWTLQDGLEALAGRKVDVAAERSLVWDLLSGE